jgi:hypothetical protein
MLIGLSLSFCVSDLAGGLVSLREVSKITTGTCYRTEEEFEAGIERYAQMLSGPWKEDTINCKVIARYLWATGKIEQPRLVGLGMDGPDISAGHWIEED